jgi:hypothetical protein
LVFDEINITCFRQLKNGMSVKRMFIRFIQFSLQVNWTQKKCTQQNNKFPFRANKILLTLIISFEGHGWRVSSKRNNKIEHSARTLINLTLNARRSKAINSIKVDKSFYLPSGFLKIILDLIICRELFLIQHNYGYETMNGNTKPWELLGIKASCVHTLKKEI